MARTAPQRRRGRFAPLVGRLEETGRTRLWTSRRIRGAQQGYLWAADPKRCRRLGDADLGIAQGTSPALVDGIVYLRFKEHIAAYDLRAQP